MTHSFILHRAKISRRMWLYIFYAALEDFQAGMLCLHPSPEDPQSFIVVYTCHRPQFLEKPSNFGCSRVIMSIYEEESTLAVLQRSWEGGKCLEGGGWDGAREAMAPLQTLPEGSCTRARWTSASFTHGLSRPCSSHQSNGGTLVWVTQRGQRIRPWKRGPAADLCLTARSLRLQDKVIKARWLLHTLGVPKALAFPAKPQ